MEENKTGVMRAKASLCVRLQELHESLVSWVEFGDLTVTVREF